MYISSKVPALDQAASWVFLSYLCNPQTQATWAAGTGYIPVRKSLDDEATIKTAVGRPIPGYKVAYDEINNGVNSAATSGSVIGPYADVRIDVLNAEESMYTGGVSPAKALANAKKAVNTTISDYNQRSVPPERAYSTVGGYSTFCVVGADEGDRHHGRNIADVRPPMARPVLDVGVARVERDLDAVVELEHGLTGNDHAIVDGGRGVHSRLRLVEVPSHPGELLFELRQRGLEVEIGGAPAPPSGGMVKKPKRKPPTGWEVRPRPVSTRRRERCGPSRRPRVDGTRCPEPEKGSPGPPSGRPRRRLAVGVMPGHYPPDVHARSFALVPPASVGEDATSPRRVWHGPIGGTYGGVLRVAVTESGTPGVCRQCCSKA